MKSKVQKMYVLCHIYIFNFISHYRSVRLAMGWTLNE